jgi:hypothetical protein
VRRHSRVCRRATVTHRHTSVSRHVREPSCVMVTACSSRGGKQQLRMPLLPLAMMHAGHAAVLVPPTRHTRLPGALCVLARRSHTRHPTAAPAARPGTSMAKRKQHTQQTATTTTTAPAGSGAKRQQHQGRRQHAHAVAAPAPHTGDKASAAGAASSSAPHPRWRLELFFKSPAELQQQLPFLR